MSNDIDISKLSDVALQSIVALKGGSELANAAHNELKIRKARQKAQEEVIEERSSLPPVPNMPNDEQMQRAEENIKDVLTRMRSELKGDK